MADLYDILGVHHEADSSEIKKAFQRLASKYHPDRNPDDPEAKVKFQAIQQAWEVLKDPEKRKRYDETGSVGKELTKREIAGQVVGDIWAELLVKDAFKPQNYTKRLRRQLIIAHDASIAAAVEATKELERFTKVIETHKLPEDGSSQIMAKLEVKRLELVQLKAHAEQASEVLEEAIKLVSEVRFTGEEPVTTTTDFGTLVKQQPPFFNSETF